MAIALADLLDEKQVILRLRSRKPANALHEIVQPIWLIKSSLALDAAVPAFLLAKIECAPS